MSSFLPVEIENITSWPKDFYEIASDHKEFLYSYHREEKRIDSLCRDDVLLRARPPINVYANKYKSLVDQLDTILNSHKIVGYHCTRLTKHEIDNIKKEGMKILSEQLIQQRLANAFSQNHLSRQEYEYLTKSSSVVSNLNNKCGDRTGMIWFCPNRSTLKNNGAVHRLFRSWGGEALYRGHEEDNQISNTLRKTGVPCIVKCQIPFKDAKHFHSSFAERFLSHMISKLISYPEPSSFFDMLLNRDLLKNDVLEIIEITNPAFEILTEYTSWDERCRIS